MIREATRTDLQGLLELYLHLHEVEVPRTDERLEEVWEKIASNPDYHIIVDEEDGMLVSSCTCIIVPNLTRQATAYTLIENVVTHEKYRGKGYASACLAYAQELATQAGCYKMMLMTGSQNPKTHAFYQHAGYHGDGKTAYFKALKEVNWKK